MKKPIILLCASLLSVNAMAATKLTTDKEKLSYIMGIEAGQNFVRNQVKIDMKAFSAGVDDMLKGKKPQLKREEAEKVIKSFQAAQAKKAAKFLNEKETAAKAFMTKSAKASGMKSTKDGLLYKVTKAGTGSKPKATDTVIVKYTGKLSDGKVFDSSYKRGKPATFKVNEVIPGWQEALKMMKEGAKWHIIIPPKLAYGMKGAGGVIGPYEPLVFDVELVAITK